MKYKTVSLALISSCLVSAFAFSENKQTLKINGAVVEAGDGNAPVIKVKKQKVPFLGVYAVPLNPAVAKQLNLSDGLYLSLEQAIPDSPAAKAGLEKFDVLMKFDDQILVNSQQLQALVRSRKKGDLVKLSILRGGKEKTVEVQLGEQQVPEAAFGQQMVVPVPGDPQFGFGGQGFPLDPGIEGLDGNLDLQLDFGDALRAQILRQIQRHRDQFGNQGFKRNPDFNDPKLLEKYDADGDGKLSRIEQDVARADGALPDLQFNFNPGAPRIEDLIRDAHRRGAASTWSSVSGSAQTKVVTMDDSGSYEFSSKDGKKRFKATDPAGNVLFDGPINTKEDRAKVPEDLLPKLKSMEGNVRTRINPYPRDDDSPQVQPRQKQKKGKTEKNKLL